MAINNPDAATKRQIHAIEDSLAKLAKEFSRFNERLRVLRSSIKQAADDVDRVMATSEKVTKRFGEVKRARGKTS